MTSKPGSHRESDRRKFMVLPLADHAVALPLESVLRVLRHGADCDDALGRMGLLQIGSHVIRVVNLHQWLPPAPVPPPPFLIVVRSPQGEPFGVWSDGLPDLIELSPDWLRSLPPSVGAAAKFLELMSHAVVLPEAEGSKTVFLLDVSLASKAPVPSGWPVPSLPEA